MDTQGKFKNPYEFVRGRIVFTRDFPRIVFALDGFVGSFFLGKRANLHVVDYYRKTAGLPFTCESLFSRSDARKLRNLLVRAILDQDFDATMAVSLLCNATFSRDVK